MHFMLFHVGLEDRVAQQAFRICFNLERHEVSFNMHPKKHTFPQRAQSVCCCVSGFERVRLKHRCFPCGK